MSFEEQNLITALGIDPVFLNTNPFTPKQLLEYLNAVAKLQQRFFHPDRWSHEGLSARDSAQIRALFDGATTLYQDTLPKTDGNTAQDHLHAAVSSNSQLRQALEFAQAKIREAGQDHQLNTELEHAFVDLLKRTASKQKSLVDFGDRKKLAIFNRTNTQNKIYQLDLNNRKIKLRPQKLERFQNKEEYTQAITKNHWGLSNPSKPAVDGYKAVKPSGKEFVEMQILGLVPKELIHNFHKQNGQPEFENIASETDNGTVNVNLLPEELWQTVFSQLSFKYEALAAKEQILIGLRIDTEGHLKLYSLGQIHDSR